MTRQAAIVGAGVVGLAIAAALARRGVEVIVLEKADRPGSETTARNSGVIHAGIYGAPDHLKTRLCVEGRRKLYAYCTERKVDHAKIGKLIVATSEDEVAALHALHTRALGNGVEGLQLIDTHQARQFEPELTAEAALFSPESGIVDAAGLVLALQGEIEDLGGVIAFRTEVDHAEATSQGFRVACGDDVLEVDLLVNSAGLSAQKLAHQVAAYPETRIPEQVLAKGNYFSWQGKSPFRHLIYPMPVRGGLGVHATLDLGGGLRFGPDVEWIDAPNYQVDPNRRDAFADAIRTWWPALDAERLSPDFAGVRPKLKPTDGSVADFLIDLPAHHGVAGLAMLFGIESPGLTSSLAIADNVARGLLDT